MRRFCMFARTRIVSISNLVQYSTIQYTILPLSRKIPYSLVSFTAKKRDFMGVTSSNGRPFPFKHVDHASTFCTFLIHRVCHRRKTDRSRAYRRDELIKSEESIEILNLFSHLDRTPSLHIFHDLGDWFIQRQLRTFYNIHYIALPIWRKIEPARCSDKVLVGKTKYNSLVWTHGQRSPAGIRLFCVQWCPRLCVLLKSHLGRQDDYMRYWLPSGWPYWMVLLMASLKVQRMGLRLAFGCATACWAPPVARSFCEILSRGLDSG